MSKKELQVVYKLRLAEKLSPIMDRLERGGESTKELWTTIKNIIHEVALETIGERPETPRGHTYASEQAKLLSELQCQLRTDIQAHMIQTQPRC